MKTYWIRIIPACCIAICAATIANAQVNETLSVSNEDDATINLSVTKPKDTFHMYRMNYWVSGIFCAVATAADIYAIPKVIKAKKDLTPAELASLNSHIFTGFDQWALRQDASKRDYYMKLSDYTLPALIVLPGILAFDDMIRKDWFRILIMYYEAHSVTFSIYNYSFFGPAFQNKYRPFVYYNDVPPSDRAGGNMRNSMYSGHTATAIASTFFLVKVYSDYHPEIGNRKYLLYGLATIPPLIEGYFRVKGLEHFPSDVMIGAVVGAACGILVPEIHRFKNHKVQFGVSSSPTGGVGMNMQWNLDGKRVGFHSLKN